MIYQLAEGNMQTIDWIYNNMTMADVMKWLGIKKTIIDSMKED